MTITSASGDSGNGTLTFSVAAHSGSRSRSTTLTINDETFTVLQGAIDLDVPPLEAQAGQFPRSTIIRVGSAGLTKSAPTGVLPAPLNLTELLIVPTERMDVIIDFSALFGESFVI